MISQPDSGCGALDESEEVCGVFFEARRDRSEVLEFVEEPLDQVATTINARRKQASASASASPGSASIAPFGGGCALPRPRRSARRRAPGPSPISAPSFSTGRLIERFGAEPGHCWLALTVFGWTAANLVLAASLAILPLSPRAGDGLAPPSRALEGERALSEPEGETAIAAGASGGGGRNVALGLGEAREGRPALRDAALAKP